MAYKKGSSNSGSLYGTQLTYGKRLVLTACIFVFMMIMAGFASQLAAYMAHSGTREHLLWTSVFQNIIGFAGTAVVTAMFLSHKPLEMMGVSRSGTWLSIGGILLVYAVGIPFLNQVIWWNSQMHLPSAFASLEQTLRSWEESAGNTTGIILSGNSIGALLVNVLTIGVVTGVCEELLFRGTFQRVIGSGPIGPHLSIWITAVIFSVLHFQFFGFLPRVLLGAFFGYMFYWTGSIWIAATAHALNNSIYVVVAWLTANGVPVGAMDGYGVTTQGFPAVACVSLCLVLFVLVALRKYLFNTRGNG